ncbi:hypothetical protein IFM89_010858 [Coptis chinensis]|uniref:Pectinesterase catalytic domain-containing protein n=1 Tax=Coptis chinensis TaxID=261450 RepID=A0A835M2W0_9MAGN|nr:hypothetical protein IFM89_010858 [Coptis chinensis]
MASLLCVVLCRISSSLDGKSSAALHLSSLLSLLIWMASATPLAFGEWCYGVAVDFALATLYYAEYNNSSRGSNISNRVTWPGYHVIDATDAVKFTVLELIVGDAWLPHTGVPYTGGPII